MRPIADVVIPIYNALHVVRPCFETVIRWTDLSRHQVILVNDGSDHHTSKELAEWESRHNGVELLTNSRNIGFVRSCNRALMRSSANYVVLLNSDTCVTPRWLDKMVACMESDASIAMASPISNFAPHMKIEMLPGTDYLEMNRLVEELSERAYPDITTPEGFCLILRRAALAHIGYFDAVFDDGYGEESDLALRANYWGYRTVCVDDAYIYHRGRGTFGDERRDQLYNQNKQIFHSRWRNRYPAQFAEFQARDPLASLRARIEDRAGMFEPAFSRK